MFPDRPLPVSSNCATAPWCLEEGDFVTPFVLEKLFDYSCSVEFAGSYYGHVPCKFRKVCLGLGIFQINYGGKLTCFGCSPHISYHWFVCLLGLEFLRCRNPSSRCSYEKSWWSYRTRWRCRCFTSIYDGSCWLPQCGLLLIQCSPAEFLWILLDGVGRCLLDLSYFPSDY